MPTSPPAAPSARRATLLALVRRTNRVMVAELISRLEVAGYPDITPAQHLVFESIDPGGTRLTALGRRAGVTRQAMTELVDALRRRGYLEVRPDPTDARARLVELTGDGRSLVRRAIKEIAAIEAEWQQCFERAGLDTDLRDLLEAALRERGEPT